MNKFFFITAIILIFCTWSVKADDADLTKTVDAYLQQYKFDEAFAAVESSANAGNAHAQWLLAVIHEKNLDSRASHPWFLKAALGGIAAAQSRIGEFYGSPTFYATALETLPKSVEPLPFFLPSTYKPTLSRFFSNIWAKPSLEFMAE